MFMRDFPVFLFISRCDCLSFPQTQSFKCRRGHVKERSKEKMAELLMEELLHSSVSEK
jgi:hypothetical protein